MASTIATSSITVAFARENFPSTSLTTFYRWERVVQDLIECARTVFLRDDLGEETKADAVQLFDTILAGEGVVQAAYAAAAHIPFDLISHNREAF